MIGGPCAAVVVLENAVLAVWRVEAPVGGATEVKGIMVDPMDAELGSGQVNERQGPRE